MDDADKVAAFTRAVQEHGAAVRGYAWAMLRDGHDADEVTQEVFRRLWQHWSVYQEQGRLRAYLLRITDRLVVDRHRANRRRMQAVRKLSRGEWSDVDGPAMDAQRKEAVYALRLALDRLTPSQQRVLLLRFYGQMSFAEIASLMRVPQNTVLSHCHRGLKALRKILAEYAP